MKVKILSLKSKVVGKYLDFEVRQEDGVVNTFDIFVPCNEGKDLKPGDIYELRFDLPTQEHDLCSYGHTEVAADNLRKLYQGKKDKYNPVESLIQSVTYTVMGDKTTVCLVKLFNGFEIVGTSACVNPADFNMEIGRQCAYKDALDKLEQFEGYKRQFDIR